MNDWTTLIAWVRMRWARCPALPQGSTRIVAVEQSTPRVPREYRALYTYLEHRYASVVVLTLEQIDALLGFALPAPARTERKRTPQRGLKRGGPPHPISLPGPLRSSGRCDGKRDHHDRTLSTAARVR
jgi:hypothetical protein